ncbi:NusG domain II-containing protein [Desulfuribacillus alkaliarsenatis]|uniref:Uncharacterized protein n=1 Tax=Desulfuribacillus alkaliarsenatis TaxID=766136 RepID=A0A1E5G4Y9_9FIRM|nr:NusG domain II-containing protein [Desulfuribacillus alkaliarsenatis]OEF98165.1 hypothetical protein BHF68_00290 [Desulfuribacillus alkaliarsenatis]
MKKIAKLKRGDFIMLLFAGIVAGALFVWTWSTDWVRRSAADNRLMAKIERDGKKVAEIDLNEITETQYIEFDEGIKVTIEAEPGRIRFLHSDCPDQICVMTGWLTREGHIAVCLPSKTVVSI